MRPTLLALAAVPMAALFTLQKDRAYLAAQPPGAPRPATSRAANRFKADPAVPAAVTTWLDIDRTFSKTSSDLSMRAALDAMFADGVIAPWQHGFTFGYLAAEYSDGRLAHFKHMACRVSEPRGWRDAAWNQRPIGAAPLAPEPQPPSLPPHLLLATTDTDVIARHFCSLMNAEAGFSSFAQRGGLSSAFADMGSNDAVNLGGPDDPQVVVGAANLARIVAPVNSDQPATITWGDDTAPVFLSTIAGRRVLHEVASCIAISAVATHR